jgi:hypothetical protein
VSHPQTGYQGVFAKIEFPPYKYVEYPKWIQNNEGKDVIVQSQQEELRVRGELVSADAVIGIEAERDLLAKQVAELQARLEKMAPPEAPKAPQAEMVTSQASPDVKHPAPAVEVKTAVVSPALAALARKP